MEVLVNLSTTDIAGDTDDDNMSLPSTLYHEEILDIKIFFDFNSYLQCNIVSDPSDLAVARVILDEQSKK